MVAKSGPGWRLVPSLVSLIDEIDERWPDRDTSSDGSIGDASHQARPSGHNPDADGDVKALDITEDEDHGPWLPGLWDLLVERRDRRIRFMIYEDLIVRSYPTAGRRPDGVVRYLPAWVPEEYFGASEHRGHIHIEVHDDPTAKAAGSWDLSGVDAMPYSEEDHIRMARIGATQALDAATVFGELSGAATIRQAAANVQALINMVGQVMADLRTTRVEVDVDEAELAKQLESGGFPATVVGQILDAYRARLAT